MTAEKRSRGRPIDLEKSRQIAIATWNVLSERGYDALTFEAVASEVGCNRATIYRRHASKAELVASVLRETLLSFAPAIDEETAPRDALHALVDTAVAYLSDARPAAILHIASLARRSPEVAEILDIHFISPRLSPTISGSSDDWRRTPTSSICSSSPTRSWAASSIT